MTESYAEAIEAAGLEDVQPRYRQLLLRLKQQDGAAYEAAVERYRSDVEEAGAGASGALDAWLAYGAWLAARMEPGELMTISESGLAEPASRPIPAGPMLVHLPEAGNRRGLVVAMPASPSAPQRETASLLCE